MHGQSENHFVVSMHDVMVVLTATAYSKEHDTSDRNSHINSFTTLAFWKRAHASAILSFLQVVVIFPVIPHNSALPGTAMSSQREGRQE